MSIEEEDRGHAFLMWLRLPALLRADVSQWLSVRSVFEEAFREESLLLWEGDSVFPEAHVIGVVFSVSAALRDVVFRLPLLQLIAGALAALRTDGRRQGLRDRQGSQLETFLVRELRGYLDWRGTLFLGGWLRRPLLWGALTLSWLSPRL